MKKIKTIDEPTKIEADFAYDYSYDTLTLYKDGQKITLSHWECLLLFHLLEVNLHP
jgi:hypothetical protein